jgi:hypothetical protein
MTCPHGVSKKKLVKPANEALVEKLGVTGKTAERLRASR